MTLRKIVPRPSGPAEYQGVPGRPILVVGGAGYIGSHTAKALSEAGESPVVVDDLSTGHEHNVRWGPFDICDIRDRSAVLEVFKRRNPRAVMHFAARAEVAVGERQPLEFYEANVSGSLNILSACLETGCRSIVFSSSCTVYGSAEYLPLDLAHPRKPTSVYGRTKKIVEDAIVDAANASDLSYAILRYFNAAGADPDGELGEEHEPETHLIPNVLMAARDGRPFQVFGTDYNTRDGTCIRDYIHVTDLAEQHQLALSRIEADHSSLVCNLGTGKGYSVFEVLAATERITGLTIDLEHCERRAGDTPVAVADAREAYRILGQRLRYSHLDRIIADAWRFLNRSTGPQQSVAATEGE